jgi:Leucine-rich repeat (LRR) protein
VAAVLATALIVGAVWGGVTLWSGSGNPDGSNLVPPPPDNGLNTVIPQSPAPTPATPELTPTPAIPELTPTPDILDVHIFTEPLIERAVRLVLAIHDDDPVTYGDLLLVTHINIQGAFPLMPDEYIQDPSDGNIQSLEDLAHMKSLRSLHLAHQPLSDISQLSENTMLREIAITACPISDLSPLLSLPNLRFLFISRTLVTDYSVIEELKSLEWLGIHHEKGVSRVSDLGDISFITELMLDNMQLVDLDGIENLPLLETLSIASTYVTDFSLLNDSAALPILRELIICPCMEQHLHTLTRSDIEVVITEFCVIV